MRAWGGPPTGVVLPRVGVRARPVLRLLLGLWGDLVLGVPAPGDLRPVLGEREGRSRAGEREGRFRAGDLDLVRLGDRPLPLPLLLPRAVATTGPGTRPGRSSGAPEEAEAADRVDCPEEELEEELEEEPEEEPEEPEEDPEGGSHLPARGDRGDPVPAARPVPSEGCPARLAAATTAAAAVAAAAAAAVAFGAAGTVPLALLPPLLPCWGKRCWGVRGPLDGVRTPLPCGGDIVMSTTT